MMYLSSHTFKDLVVVALDSHFPFGLEPNWVAFSSIQNSQSTFTHQNFTATPQTQSLFLRFERLSVEYKSSFDYCNNKRVDAS
jgi:hypothetical protein